MSEALNRPALVLNKNWVPINITTVRCALKKVFNDLALLVDPDTYTTYDFEGWTELPIGENDGFLNTTSIRIRLLESNTLIVIMRGYEKVPTFEVKLTRKNLLVRDGHRCAYTNEFLTLRDATIDHVIPKGKGGKHSWNNVVISSFKANLRKGRRTPEEASMHLLRKPYRPKWNPMFTACVRHVPECWKHFMRAEKMPELARLSFT